MDEDEIRRVIINRTTNDVLIEFMGGKCENYKLTNQPLMIERASPEVRRHAREAGNELYDRKFIIMVATNDIEQENNIKLIN